MSVKKVTTKKLHGKSYVLGSYKKLQELQATQASYLARSKDKNWPKCRAKATVERTYAMANKIRCPSELSLFISGLY